MPSMIDVKRLREDPEGVKQAIARKKFNCDINAVLALDGKRRNAITEWERVRSEQKGINREMAGLDKKSAEFREKVGEMKTVSRRVKELEVAAKEADETFQEALMAVPNPPDPEIPDGDSETDHRSVHSWGAAESREGAIPHWEIPWFETMVDFERGAKVTGAGFPFYVGPMAKLVRSLITFFLDEAERVGYRELLAPLLVNAASATATGQLPDKEGQMYADLNEGLYLIPTAEVPVTNFFREEILDEALLPVMRCAYTPCFRREAGSWGAHVRGLNRVHQFDKVELVQWVKPEQSASRLEGLREHSQALLEKLELPYRTRLMAAGDIGFPHYRQYDLEVWSAGQNRWLEVSSCSNFTDFQARRAGIRYRVQGGKPEHVHTLNGSALAIPRTLAALLESRYNPEDHSIVIPDVLRPYFGGDILCG